MINKTPELSFTHDQRTYALDPTTLASDVVDYECPVCKAFMIEPQRVCSEIDTGNSGSWGHRLCRACLIQLRESACPLCRRQIQKTAATTDFASIANLRVYCPNQDCATTLPVSPTMAEAKRHLAEECLEEMIECPAGCGTAKMKRKTLGAHEPVCSLGYPCECGQILSGASSQKEIRRHVNANPEQHPHRWLINFFCLPKQRTSGARDYQQPPVIAHTPQSRCCAGVECISIAKDVYQSIANPRTLFVTVAIEGPGYLYKLIPYRDDPDGPLEELKITISAFTMANSDMLDTKIHGYTRNQSSQLTSVTITAYTGDPAQPFRAFTITPPRGYEHVVPMSQQFFMLVSSAPIHCNPGSDGNYLFKIEI